MCIVSWSIFSIIVIASMQGTESDIIVEITGNIFFSSPYLMSDDISIKNKTDVENFIARILCKYTDAGFPFCRIHPEIIYADNKPEKIILNVEVRVK